MLTGFFDYTIVSSYHKCKIFYKDIHAYIHIYIYSIPHFCQLEEIYLLYIMFPFFTLQFHKLGKHEVFFCDGEEFEEGYDIRSRLILRLFSTVIIDMYESLEQKRERKVIFRRTN